MVKLALRMYKSYFFIITCFLLAACNTGRDNQVKTENRKQIDSLSFEAKYYLKISNIYSGPVFNDGTGRDFFYRIIEIPQEEHVLFFVEKISLLGEGGNCELRRRYKIEEKKFSLPNYSFFSVDSLMFKDSTTISGYFNRNKFLFDLAKETTLK